MSLLRAATIALLLALAVAPARAAEPASEPGTSRDSGGFGAILNALKARPLVEPDLARSFAALATHNIDQTRAWTDKVRGVLGYEANQLFFAILWPVLLAEVTFAGFRILLRAPIAEQFLRLATITFILVAVKTVLTPANLQGPTPNGPPLVGETIFNQAADQLLDAGRALGGEIIHAGLTDPTHRRPAFAALGRDAGSLEPISYWLAWIGSPRLDRNGEPVADEQPVNPATEYKFSLASITQRVWGDRDDPSLKVGPGTSSTADSPRGFNLADMVGFFENFGLNVIFPFILLGVALSIAAMQLCAIAGVVFSYLAVMIATTVTLQLMLGFSLILLPLIYFRSFERLWSHVLTLVAGATLIGCLYYVFAAIGLVFTDNLYEGLFPLNPPANTTDSLAHILNAVFLNAAHAVAAASRALLPSSLVFSGTDAAVAASLYLGRLTFGTMVLTVLIGAGVGFAMLAPAAAFRWRQGFGLETVFGRVTEGLFIVRHSAGSALGAIYSNAIGNVTRFAGRNLPSPGRNSAGPR